MPVLQCQVKIWGVSQVPWGWEHRFHFEDLFTGNLYDEAVWLDHPMTEAERLEWIEYLGDRIVKRLADEGADETDAPDEIATLYSPAPGA